MQLHSFANLSRTVCGAGMVVAQLRIAGRDPSICVWRLGLPTYHRTKNPLVLDSSHRCLLRWWADDDQVSAGLGLGAYVLTQSLMLAFIYTYAQDNRGKKAHFVILQIPVELLPWAMLTLTLIMGGPQAALQQATGVFAAHLYDFLTRLYPTFQGGRNYIQTPAAIKRYFGADRSAFTNRAYGSSFTPAQNVPQQQSRSWTSGFSSTWNGRGAGRRLGGD